MRSALVVFGWAAVLLLAACAAPQRLAAPAVEGMVRVPAGAFIMGQDAADGEVGVEVGIDSMPRHRVVLPEFWIDRTEVTVGDYRVFLAASGHQPFSDWAWSNTTPREDQPVIAVKYDDAAAYCAWAGKRLPTEAEWEKAARGKDGRLYPWGNRFDAARVVSVENGHFPDPVGSHPDNASPYGALDMAGNVAEWTATWYRAHPGSDLQRVAFGEQYRVLKGGSWGAPEVFLRSANRHASLPELGAPAFGFRCAKSQP
ncbi:MAG: formylglycine-generating enzyme family protein [Nitrospirota bacterium]|nr:formylglycine-generating enzyme family protein [Nitrospirota bacterium]